MSITITIAVTVTVTVTVTIAITLLEGFDGGEVIVKEEEKLNNGLHKLHLSG